VAFFIIPTIAGFLCFGQILIAAIYQTGRFSQTDAAYVWYVLAGSTIGMLAITRGRLYNSAFYALHDTTTPLRFAVVRVALTALLGYLFAFPLRPLIAWLIADMLRLPAPRPEDTALVFGAVGLASSAGIAGWVEYLLLSSAMGKRIGGIDIRRSFYAKLWGSALLAGAGTALTLRALLPALRGLGVFRASLVPIMDGVCALTAFAVLYLPATSFLGIEEGQRLLKWRWHK
jgi:putative peptidoglycan lipid II flippase